MYTVVALKVYFWGNWVEGGRKWQKELGERGESWFKYNTARFLFVLNVGRFEREGKIKKWGEVQLGQLSWKVCLKCINYSNKRKGSNVEVGGNKV